MSYYFWLGAEAEDIAPVSFEQMLQLALRADASLDEHYNHDD